MPEFVKSDGGSVYYDVRGPDDGPPLLLIEGLSAHMLGWREEFCDYFVRAGYRVIRFDNRDVGLSAHYPGRSYGIGDMADDVHELIDHLGVAPVHVVGQSMGGMITQEFAMRHPSDVASVALLYTTASSRYLTLDESRQSLQRAATRKEAIELHITQERVCASRDYSFDEAWKRELGGLMFDRCYDPDGVARQLQAVQQHSVESAALAGLTVPTLIIHGTADNLIPHDASVELHEAIPGSDLWLIEGMGHDLPRELWGELASRIIQNASSGRRAAGEPAEPVETSC
jgi:pimeloyl-ACP methyl ester carboxylesterase